MAGQFEIAHSKLVVGAAIIAGGPYGCADSAYSNMMPGPGAAFLNLSQAMNGCMLNAMRFWGVPNPDLLAEKTKRLAEDDRIDPIADVMKDRIYLFSGSNDHTVVPAHRRRRGRILHRPRPRSREHQAGRRSCPPVMPS